ncbi:MAG TPA: response regulator [Abditibacteriaceae bacterium]|jgi:DNA-binding response OmpR family regulator
MPHTVLIVEDDNNQRALYAEELGDEGYTILSAPDGREAIRIVESNRPDIIVLDINMPGMDGLDTLNVLLEKAPGIPVIINSAYASYKESFTSWSADAYIVKSSDLSEMKETVKRLLENPPNA